MKLSILNRLLLVLLAMTALFGEMFLRLWNVERDRRDEVLKEQAEMHQRVFEHACRMEAHYWKALLREIAHSDALSESLKREPAGAAPAWNPMADKPEIRYLWLLDAGGKTMSDRTQSGERAPVLKMDMPKLLDRLDQEPTTHFFDRLNGELVELSAAPVPTTNPLILLVIAREVDSKQRGAIEQLAKVNVKLTAAGAELQPNEVGVDLPGLDGEPVARLTGVVSGAERSDSVEVQKKQWLNLVFIILGFFVVVALLVWLWVGSESLARGGAGKILELSRGSSELGPFATMLAKFRREQDKLAEEMRVLQAAEAATREREELFRAIFNQAEQLIVQLNPSGEVTRINSMAIALTSGEASWVGELIENAPIWKNRERAARQFQQALETTRSGATAQFELDVKNPAGETVQFGCSLKPVYRDEAQTELLLLLLEGNDLSTYRKMEAEVIRASEDERGRIGLDLHDGLCQELTAADCCLKLSEMRLGKGDQSGLDDLTAARGMLTNAISGARDLARLLSPLVLSQKGLAISLEELAMNARRMFDVACDVRIGRDVSCDEEVAKHLYRIAQEGIQNSIRHGQASRIEIDLTRDDSGLTLEIADNGTGVPPEILRTWNVSRDRGLKTIRYRVRLIGGTLSLAANEPEGLVVTCHVPND